MESYKKYWYGCVNCVQQHPDNSKDGKLLKSKWKYNAKNLSISTHVKWDFVKTFSTLTQESWAATDGKIGTWHICDHRLQILIFCFFEYPFLFSQNILKRLNLLCFEHNSCAPSQPTLYEYRLAVRTMYMNKDFRALRFLIKLISEKLLPAPELEVSLPLFAKRANS